MAESRDEGAGGGGRFGRLKNCPLRHEIRDSSRLTILATSAAATLRVLLLYRVVGVSRYLQTSD